MTHYGSADRPFILLLQSPKQNLQRNSDEGLQGDQSCQTAHITAGDLHVAGSKRAGIPCNDSALFSSVEPLDHTPPVTDEHSQRRSMQACLCYSTCCMPCAHNLKASIL